MGVHRGCGIPGYQSEKKEIHQISNEILLLFLKAVFPWLRKCIEEDRQSENL